VAEGARLLLAVLPPRIPGGLQLVIARAVGDLDVPPFATPDDFRAAVRRFAGVAADLVDISDVRRARRDSRHTLERVARDSGLSRRLIRELEWGDFREWHHAEWIRRVCDAYARAAGLDPERVLTIVEAERARQQADLSAAPVVPVARRRHTGRAAAVAAAVFAVGLLTGGALVHRIGEKSAADYFGIAAVPLPAVHEPATDTGAGELDAVALDGDDADPSKPLDAGAQAGSESDSTTAKAGVPDAASASAAPEADAGSGSTLPRAADGSAPSVSPQAPAATSGSATSGSAIGQGRVATPRRFARAASLREASAAGPASFSPAFSSAGSAVFYHRDDGAGSALIKADTDNTTGDLRIVSILEDGARNYHVKPSPDGARIAFDSDRDGERGVYVANADGSGVRRISGPGFAAVPSWSPDGTRLAFVRGEPAARGRVWNLWVLDLASNASVRLTSHRYGQPWGASWFPGGRRLAYSHEDRLIVLDLESGARRVFRSPQPGRLMRTPAVSPDGRHIVFQVHRDGAWLLDLGDGSMQRILADPTAEEFAWDATGRRLAFHSRRSGEWSVWIMSAQASPTS
jgi:cytoskeletal protein RodZ